MISLIRQATKLFPSVPYVSRSTVKHLRREWIAIMLGRVSRSQE